MTKKGGEMVYESAPASQSIGRRTVPRHVTENEANFRTIFIGVLAERIAHDFYPFQGRASPRTFATDASFLAN